MPLGLWKSKWEIHREEMVRLREESDRRSAEHREEMERQRVKTEDFFAEMRAERALSDERWQKSDERWEKSDERWQRIDDDCRELRARYADELEETRRSNQAILARMERNERNIEAATKLLSEQAMGMRRDLHELKDAVGAQTQAIFTLVDRFDEADGRPPV